MTENTERTLSKGDKVWKQTAAWIEKNPHAYEYLHANALNMAARDGRLSINMLVMLTRYACKVHIPNVISPALARYLMATDMRLRGKFVTCPSCTDGYFPTGGEQ